MTPNSLVKDVTVEHRTPRLVLFLYIFLLVFEGALRKWVLPSMSSVLVLARDPLVLYLVFYGLKRGWLRNAWVHIAFFASFISLIVALARDIHWEVAYYGAHSFLLYYPCIFVLPHILTMKDVYRIGVAFLLMSIPMSALVFVQYGSPKDAWVNIGVGGEGSSTFGGVLDFFRPAGTFSFITGLVGFQGVVGMFLSWFLFDAKARGKSGFPYWLLLITLGLYIALVPLSLSRTNVFQSVFIFLVGALPALRKQKMMNNLFLLLAVGIVAFIVYNRFAESFDILFLRFDEASNVEGGVVEGSLGNRLLGSFLQIFEVNAPFFGNGIGTATSIAISKFGYPMVYWQDAELPRQVYESGVVLGLVYILLRVVFALKLMTKVIVQQVNNSGAAFFFSPCIVFFLLFGQWGNSAIQGFSTLSLGLLLKLLARNE